MPQRFDDWEGKFLQHHGVRNQKWGVRQWQNQDGSLTPEGYIHYYGHPKVDVKNLDKKMKKGLRDSSLTEAHTIPKGTKIYRTTASSEDSQTGSTYVSYMDVDRQHYKSGWIRQQGSTGTAYEHTYELQEDLKVPSRKEVSDVVQEVMKNNKKLVEETCKAWLDAAVPEGSWERVERMWSDAKNEKEAQKAWKEYTKDTIERYKNMTPDEATFFTMQSLGLNPKVKKEVISKLSAKGYNAMTDEASVGGRHGYLKEGGDPLIVFDRSNMFKEISNKQVSKKEENKAAKSYIKNIRKARLDRSKSW